MKHESITAVDYNLRCEGLSSDTVYFINDGTITESRVDYDYEVIFQEMAKRFNKVPIMDHKCHNCGGTVELETDKHIFNCPYCDSVYAIGTSMINSR